MQLKLPELGEGVHEGEIISWKVRPGDVVKEDQPVCEIMTDKATVELPSSFHGRVQRLLAKEGETLKVGTPLLDYEGVAQEAAVPEERLKVVAEPAASPEPSQERVRATPGVRRLARTQGVAISAVPPSGPGGRVLREDVLRAATQGPASVTARLAPPLEEAKRPEGRPEVLPELEHRVPFLGLRKRIAERMRLSKDTAAHFTYVEEADVTELVRVRTEAKTIGEARDVKVTYLPFVLKAMVAALKRHPIVNASLDDDRQEVVFHDAIHVALSIQTDDGLVAPVIRDVDRKTILALAKDIQDLSQKARAKHLQPRDFQGSTITLTNIGTIGGLFATPIINYPNVAIVGFNKIGKKPVVRTVDGKETVVIRDWTYFSISLDHRVVDGAIGAEFMKDMIRFIEKPELLWLEA